MRHILTTLILLSVMSGAKGAESPTNVTYAPADTSATPLGEVSVTAIKHSSSLMRQPVTVTTINQRQIERFNVSGMKGVSEIAPNFYMPDYGSRMTSSIYVRGIGTRIDQPAVGLNIDNIPYLNKNSYDFDMLDVERIEVLRGPQSTLYGRNTIAGLINVYTLSPLSYQGLRFMAEGSLPGAYRAGVGVYHKLAPRLGMSINGYASHTHGYFRNLHNGKHADGTTDFSGRWRTVWRPTDRLSIENVLSAGHSKQSGYPYAYVETGDINYNDTCFYRRTSVTDGLTVRWIGPHFSIASITGLQYLKDNMTLDQDFLPDSYFTLTQRQYDRSVTQDIVIRGNAGNYSWLAGVFGFYKHNRMTAPVTFKEDGIDRLILKNINSKLPEGMELRWNDDEFILGNDFRTPTKGIAVYHRSTLDLGKWALSASLRFDYEQTALSYHSNVNTSATMYRMMGQAGMVPLLTQEIAIDDYGKLKKSFRELLPNVSVTYNMKNSAVFLSVAKGFKAGGFNTQMFSNILQSKMMAVAGHGEDADVDQYVSYKPETSWNYELGGHFSCDQGRVYSTFSAFFIDVRDQQVTVFPEGDGTGRMMANAGRTRSLGAELTLRYTPSARWRFDLAYGYTNATFRHFFDGHDDLSGKRVPYAPSNTLFLSAAYRMPVRSSMVEAISFCPTLRGTGSIYWDEMNIYRQPFYAELGASIRLEHSRYSLDLWGKNLTDTKFDVFRYESIGNNFFQRGKPLCAGITLRIHIDNI
ncbi:TonB-dependent receptor [uncultured Duncaniella sp.]|nr:TonB-dependent receptor [uncultured Duncaniella sp.]